MRHGMSFRGIGDPAGRRARMRLMVLGLLSHDVGRNLTANDGVPAPEVRQLTTLSQSFAHSQKRDCSTAAVVPDLLFRLISAATVERLT